MTTKKDLEKENVDLKNLIEKQKNKIIEQTLYIDLALYLKGIRPEIKIYIEKIKSNYEFEIIEHHGIFDIFVNGEELGCFIVDLFTSGKINDLMKQKK